MSNSAVSAAVLRMDSRFRDLYAPPGSSSGQFASPDDLHSGKRCDAVIPPSLLVGLRPGFSQLESSASVGRDLPMSAAPSNISLAALSQEIAMQIAGIQTDVRLMHPEENLQLLEQAVRTEVAQGTGLTVFPECFLTGYCFDSPEEALPFAETIPGPATDRVARLCAELKTHVVFGMLERSGSQLFNVAVLIGPDGYIGHYRKVHLPFLGVDRFTTPGDRPFEVFEASGVRIGMLICYDGGFPEASRVLALRGADVILLPTNWPPGSETMAQFAVNARAMENAVYFVSVNRVGSERGFHFIGKSRICSPSGDTLETIDSSTAGVIRATIDVNRSRTKRLVRVPGKHVIDRMADRRPELYGPICEPHQLRRPGRDEPV